jgi:hypothetical protein
MILDSDYKTVVLIDDSISVGVTFAVIELRDSNPLHLDGRRTILDPCP